MPAQTSIEAYRSLKLGGKMLGQRCRVLEMVCRNPEGITRRQISKGSGLELGAVAGRVNELVDERLLLEDGELQTCRYTGNKVKLVKPVGLERLPLGEHIQQRMF